MADSPLAKPPAREPRMLPDIDGRGCGTPHANLLRELIVIRV